MKKMFLCVCVKWSKVKFDLFDRKNRSNKILFIFFESRSYSCFYWSNWSNWSKMFDLCGVAAFLLRSNNLCCGQIALLRAAFIGQTRCQIAFCVNYSKT